ncbi:hypothetical protein VE04_04157 [Pseudogymnoascus sp. 24MN13]|nr:hypothetical protein VE04_04157 [Pseudogymnoascus sp. 24MN13]
MAKQVTFEVIKAQSLSRSRSVSPRKRQMTISDGGQHTTKRLCLDDRFGGTSRQGTPARTLLTYTGTSLPSVSSPEILEQSDLDMQTLVRSRRPSDPSLYCCDYNKAKKESREGMPGKPEFGGAYVCDRAYVCDQCRGVEYREDRDKDVEDVFFDPE